MSVPEEFPQRLASWCREAVPAAERAHRRLGWAIHDDEVRITDRRAPEYPELAAAWTSTPVARLRYRDPGPGLWTLYRPGPEPERWERFGAPGGDPFALLEGATR
ncbi:MAG: hypothetical protein AB7J32_17195 [Pseudonocardia sp.]